MSRLEIAFESSDLFPEHLDHGYWFISTFSAGIVMIFAFREKLAIFR